MNLPPISSCPLCAARLPSASLELHLRLELGYAASEEGRAHFRGPFAAHPADAVLVLAVPDAEKDRRLLELLGRGPGLADEAGVLDATVELAEPPRKKAPPSAKAARAAAPLKKAVPLYDHSSEMEQPYVPTPVVAFYPPPTAPSPPTFVTSLPRVKEEVAEEAAEAKYAPRLDGKVSCILCGERQDKSHFKLHALRRHLSVQPLFCLTCPFKGRRLDTMKRHLKTVHDEPLTLDATYSSILNSLKGDIADMSEKCFGADTASDYVKKECRSCKIPVTSNQLRLHIVSKHLKKALFRCAFCPYGSATRAPVLCHVKKKHEAEDPVEAFTDDTPKFAPVIKSMMAELFKELDQETSE